MLLPGALIGSEFVEIENAGVGVGNVIVEVKEGRGADDSDTQEIGDWIEEVDVVDDIDIVGNVEIRVGSEVDTEGEDLGDGGVDDDSVIDVEDV